MKRAAFIAGAVTCLALAVVLALLAADVSRWRNALRADDVRYRMAPAASLWSPGALVPLGIARNMLGISDDLAFRRAVDALRLSKLGDTSNSDPKLVLQRAEAEERLYAIANGRGDPARRSRAMGLLAVLRLSTPAASPSERATVLKAAVANLQQAVALDPTNDDAKYNLEVTLRRSRGVQTIQGGPTPNSKSSAGTSKGAATGPPGSGY